MKYGLTIENLTLPALHSEVELSHLKEFEFFGSPRPSRKEVRADVTVYSYFMFLFQLLAGAAGFFPNFYRFEYIFQKQFISQGIYHTLTLSTVEELMHSISRTYIALAHLVPLNYKSSVRVANPTILKDILFILRTVMISLLKATRLKQATYLQAFTLRWHVMSLPGIVSLTKFVHDFEGNPTN